ncbi:MAG: glycosyltransferase family 4 protein [Eubacterium sp.]|nr:glycosyltransferase family 4 protein [Eubacterium sp.]
MKIAVLSSHTPSLFWFRLDMMQSFIDKGHKVYALGNEAESDWADKFGENGIVYRQIYVQRNGTNPVKDLKSITSIKSVLAEIMPDKIFTYQAKTIIYGTIAANKLGITEVYPLIAGLGSLFLNDDAKTKALRKIMLLEYKYSMRKCPLVFFQNTDDLNTFKSAGVINKQKTLILHGSGVSLEKFTVQPMPEQFAFLCISRLIRDKGVYEYLKACEIVKKNNPNVRFLLVGPFDTNPSALKKNELQVFIDNGTIEYFGEQADVVPYYKQASVYVLPSYREGTPKTVLEAMACGRAVITTDVPGCRETVDDNVNGLLVPAKDVEKLALAMQFMIDNPDEVCRMAANGRNKAEEVFDVNKINASICDAMKL